MRMKRIEGMEAHPKDSAHPKYSVLGHPCFYYGFLIPHSLCCGVSSYPTLEKGGKRGDFKINKVYLNTPRCL